MSAQTHRFLPDKLPLYYDYRKISEEPRVRMVQPCANSWLCRSVTAFTQLIQLHDVGRGTGWAPAPRATANRLHRRYGSPKTHAGSSRSAIVSMVHAAGWKVTGRQRGIVLCANADDDPLSEPNLPASRTSSSGRPMIPAGEGRYGEGVPRGGDRQSRACGVVGWLPRLSSRSPLLVGRRPGRARRSQIGVERDGRGPLFLA